MASCVAWRVSSTQVSRATRLLDEELERWRNRPLGDVPLHVFLDARYEKIRHGGAVVSCAVLMAFGVDESGHRTVLGASVSLSEAEVHWRDFFAGLQARGLSGVRLLIQRRSCRHESSAVRPAFPACPGNAASFICSRMPDTMCRGSRCAVRWPPICGRSTNRRIGWTPSAVCARPWTSMRSAPRS